MARGRGQVRNRKVRLVWEVAPHILANDLDDHWKRTEQALYREFERAGQDILSYAKREHPWTNRTGDAEGGLSVNIYWEGETLRMDIQHGVYYGIFLEKRWGGKWGVIPMAMDYGAPRVRAALDSVMRGAG